MHFKFISVVESEVLINLLSALLGLSLNVTCCFSVGLFNGHPEPFLVTDACLLIDTEQDLVPDSDAVCGLEGLSIQSSGISPFGALSQTALAVARFRRSIIAFAWIFVVDIWLLIDVEEGHVLEADWHVECV
ncbi:hypothetical protein ACTXT7_017589 [Hymenolepis weldensis]